MAEIILRELASDDKNQFIQAMNASFSFHSPWVNSISIKQAFW